MAALDQLVASMLAKPATPQTTTTAKTAGKKGQAAPKAEKVSILRAARDGDVEAINEAIRKGGSSADSEAPVVELEGMFGARPLHLAAAAGGPAAVAVLLGAGANPLAQMKDGKNALHCAALEGRHDTLSLLVPAVDKAIKSQLTSSVSKSAPSSSEVAPISPVESDPTRNSPSPASPPALSSWLCDNQNNTPLHLAVLSGKADSVELLLASPIQREALSIANVEGKKPADLSYLKSITDLIQRHENGSLIDNDPTNNQKAKTENAEKINASDAVIRKKEVKQPVKRPQPRKEISTTSSPQYGTNAEYERENTGGDGDGDEGDTRDLNKKMDLLMWSMQEIRRENAELKRMLRTLLNERRSNNND